MREERERERERRFFTIKIIYITQVLSTAALIPASVALSDQQNLSAELNKDRNVASGLVVGVAVISIVLELVMVALRFANIGYLNYNIRLFLIAVSLLDVYIILAFT